MKNPRLLNIAPDDDQGSEAIYGFEFQNHCIARNCIEMVRSLDIKEIICEFHEDLTKIKVTQYPSYCQIKKRESADTISIDTLKDAISKLIKKGEYKDVGELIIYSHGRPSLSGDFSLANLIALLDRPVCERDSDWEGSFQLFKKHFVRVMPDIDPIIIEKGLRLLKICLTMPHPDSIMQENSRLTAQTIFEIWGVHVEYSIAENAYDSLYKRVCEASRKAKQPPSVKTITAKQSRELIREILKNKGLLAEDQDTILDLHEKLEIGKLKNRNYLVYALQARMDARQIKFELDISSSCWRDYKDSISVAWERKISSQPTLSGVILWQELRKLLDELGKEWSDNTNSSVTDSHFAEGVFFDMLAICEANLEA